MENYHTPNLGLNYFGGIIYPVKVIVTISNNFVFNLTFPLMAGVTGGLTKILHTICHYISNKTIFLLFKNFLWQLCKIHNLLGAQLRFHLVMFVLLYVFPFIFITAFPVKISGLFWHTRDYSITHDKNNSSDNYIGMMSKINLSKNHYLPYNLKITSTYIINNVLLS